MELDHPPFDAIILGSDLQQSILAAALAHAGKTVLHVDENEYYGGDWASLNLEELIQWGKERTELPEREESNLRKNQRRKFSNIEWSFPSSSSPNQASVPEELKKHARSYSLSLAPVLFPSISPLISALISSGVSRYSNFRLLETTSMFFDRELKTVPGNKEDVFKTDAYGLVDKRRLMKCLKWAIGEFEASPEFQGQDETPLMDFLVTKFNLPPPIATSLTYALAHCVTPTEPALPALERMRSYLQSIGKYGNSSPFLVAPYGGAGEIVQGFCRGGAVQGGIYILGRKVGNIKELVQSGEEGEAPSNLEVSIDGFSQPIKALSVVASPDYLPSTTTESKTHITKIHRCILILDHYPSILPTRSSIEDSSEVPSQQRPDTGFVVYPPHSMSSEVDNCVHGILMGQGTESCPVGQYILYLTSLDDSASVTPSELFQPYINSIVGPERTPLFTFTFSQKINSSLPDGTFPPSTPSTPHLHIMREPSPNTFLTEGPSECVAIAEEVFKKLHVRDVDDLDSRGFFDPPVSRDDEDEIGEW